jgi:hypothetical protein
MAPRHQEMVSRRIAHDGLDHPQATDTVHAGPTIYLGGTHTFLFVGPTILLRDSWLKIYVFSCGEQKRPILFKIIYSYFIYKLYYSVFSLRFCSVTNYFVL